MNSEIVAEIIYKAVENADYWGLGRISVAKQAVEEAGYKWSDELEKFVFDIDKHT